MHGGFLVRRDQGEQNMVQAGALFLTVALGMAMGACDSFLDPDEPPLSGDPPGVPSPVDRAIVEKVEYTVALSEGRTLFGYPEVGFRVRARNLSDEFVTVLIDRKQPGCHWRVRAYPTENMRAPAAFDDGRLGYVCTADLKGFALEPGDIGEQLFGMAHSTILGDSLPEGTYYFTVAFRPNDVPAIEVAAGAQELVRWTPDE